MIAEDVAAIDTWLDNYAGATGLGVQKSIPSNHSEYVWRIDAALPYTCEVEYKPDTNGIVVIRLVSKSGGDTLISKQAVFSESCADHGLQPRLTKHSDGIRGTTEYIWGVKQYISTQTLSTNLLTTIVDRLQSAMDTLSAEYNL